MWVKFECGNGAGGKLEMNRDYFDERNRIGSVKAAINLYGKIHDENPALKEPQMDISEV